MSFISGPDGEPGMGLTHQHSFADQNTRYVSISKKINVSVQEEGLFLEWIPNYNAAFSTANRRQNASNIVSGLLLRMNGPKRLAYWEAIQ